MDYEKAYKKALERAKKNYDVAQDLCNGSQIGVERFKNTLTNIFPELGESEYERIRKRLIDLIYKVYAFTNYITCVEYENIIAWLEKQESVREVVERCKNSWYNEGKIAGMAEGLTNDEKYQQGWHDALEKQGEQKQEWSEEDDYNLQCMIAKVTYDIQKGNVGRNNELIDWLKSLKERVQPQPKQEWSDEDENYLQSAENACEYQYGKNTSTILWLKSLKERMKGKEDKQ